jgi:hypothetical protein
MMRRFGMRLAASVVARLTPEKNREALLGDLAEEFELRAKSGAASAWYFRQVATSLPPLAWAQIKKGVWLATLGAALAAYVAVAITELSLNALIMKIFGPGFSLSGALRMTLGFPVLMLIGFCASRVRRGAAATLAAMMGIVAITVMVTTTETVPVWFWFVYIVAGPMAVVLGGRIRSARRAKP